MNRLTSERLESLLERVRGVRVLVVGDLMLDVYLRGRASRISPEAPVPVVRVEDERRALGGAANVAANVVALGAACRVVGCVGSDRAGDDLLVELAKAGIAAEAIVRTPGRPTTVKTRIMSRRQQVARYDREDDGDVDETGERALRAALADAAPEADVIVLEDYNKGVLVPAVIERAIATARARGIPVVVDPKYRNFFAYRGATVFKPNRRELEAALGAAMDVEHPETLPATVERLEVEHLLLTLGERGMMLVSRDGAVTEVPTTAREVYDVVGAGDTVTAYLAAMLAAGATAREAAVIANFAAGVEVGKLGAATVSAEEVLEAYDVYVAHHRL